jgi:hypothetical protein
MCKQKINKLLTYFKIVKYSPEKDITIVKLTQNKFYLVSFERGSSKDYANIKIFSIGFRIVENEVKCFLLCMGMLQMIHRRNRLSILSQIIYL